LSAAKSLRPTPDCLVCLEPIEQYAIGGCNHREVCAHCVLKIRLLGNELNCSLCKRPLDVLVVTSHPTRPFIEYDLQKLHCEPAWSLYTDDEQFLEAMRRRVNGFVCPRCDLSCGSRGALHRHLEKQHHLKYCRLCAEHRHEWLCDQSLYTNEQLRKHQTKGDGAVKGGGHPLCQFCKSRFYGNEELYHHLHTKHETCFLCQKAGRADDYFRDYQHLEHHFERNHFICNDPECRAKRFVAFSDAIALQAHDVCVCMCKVVVEQEEGHGVVCVCVCMCV
jgi:E3 ubiquitin-protein ligase ZNF598